MFSVVTRAQCVKGCSDQSLDAALKVYVRSGVDVTRALYLVAWGGPDGCLVCAAEKHVSLIRFEEYYASLTPPQQPAS